MPRHGMFGVPEQVANYTILSRIGKGGMASVYLARQWGPDGFARNVALKLLPPRRAATQAYVEMFRGEARVGALIEHPNVCRVLDFGEADGHYYIALEYLVGEPLSALISRVGRDSKWLSDGRYFTLLARMLAQCCDGLHAAHQALDTQGQALNVVHRDVSPHNLFALYDGTTRVVDFGVARYDSREYATTIKVLRGKVAYMSPEYVTGGDVDARSDVWSLGVVLWEVLTGQRLFRRPTEIETMRAVAACPVPAPFSRNSGAPPGLSEIALKALERDPNDRYQSAAEMGAELDAWAASSGHSSHASAVRELMHELFEGGEQSKLELVARFKGVVSSGIFERGPTPDEPAEAMPLITRADKPDDAEPTPTGERGDTTEDELDSELDGNLDEAWEIDSSELILGPAAEPSTLRVEVAELEQERPTVPRGIDSGLTPVVAVQPRAGRALRGWALLAGAGLVFAALLIGRAGSQAPASAEPVLAPGRALDVTRLALPQLELGVAREEAPARVAGREPSLGGEAREVGHVAGAPVAETGDLYVAATDKIAVYHGDRLLGITPLRARLPAGVQSLEARFPDGHRQLLSTQIVPGSVALLSLSE